jgi:hypothetical protein
MELGKPVFLLFRGKETVKGGMTGMRVEDAGKSECHAVMAWIRIE